MTIPLRLMEYARSWNLGDEIQSIAVGQHIAQVDGYIDRDQLDQFDGDPVAVVMNGWFTKRPATLPPSPAIRPVYVGFHLSHHCVDLLADHAVRDHLIAWGPIGCRDSFTADVLDAAGVDAFVSGCMTTTFPRREKEPDDGSIYLVDTTGVPLPEHIRGDRSIRVTHQGAPWWSQEAKRLLAHDLLAEYRDQARLVVTTRLHCALPCVAMGIPVIFVGDPDDERLSPIRGLAEMIPFPASLRNETPSTRVRRRALWHREMRDQPWKGYAADLEEAKAQRITQLRSALARAGA